MREIRLATKEQRNCSTSDKDKNS